MITKEQIRNVYDNWGGSTAKEISLKFGIKLATVSCIAASIRKAGITLPRKSRGAYVRQLIIDTLVNSNA